MTKMYSQSNSFIDSLKADTSNSIIVYEYNCICCIVLDSPCDEYQEGGHPKDQYIIWKNVNGYHIKRFNVCGSSKTLTFKNWENNPFNFVDVYNIELDTTKLLYPLSFDRNDSIWFETSINHYSYYKLSFVTYGIKEILIKDYAFEDPKDDPFFEYETELYKTINQKRYNYNKESEIKVLLDIIHDFLRKHKEQFEILKTN